MSPLEFAVETKHGALWQPCYHVVPVWTEKTPCISLAFAQGLQILVIKMTGGVTFYTSFEVQRVTAIMLKEKVYWGEWKKTLWPCCIMSNFERRPSLLSSIHRWKREFTLTCFVSSPRDSCCQEAVLRSLHAWYVSVITVLVKNYESTHNAYWQMRNNNRRVAREHSVLMF